MATISEDYVSFETAKLLKEKGFEIDTDLDYWKIGEDGTRYFMCSIGAYTSDKNNPYAFYRPENSYPCPTQAVAMKWLREVHHLYIQVMLDSWACGGHMGYYIVIQNTTSDFEIMLQDFVDDVFYDTYEDACKAAIKYCLEHLI